MNPEGLPLYVLLKPLSWHIRCCFAIGTACPPVVVAGCYRNSERKEFVENNEDVSIRLKHVPMYCSKQGLLKMNLVIFLIPDGT